MRLLALVALTVALIAGGVATLMFLRIDDPNRLVESEISDARLAFPAGYARDDAAGAGGFTDRLALIARFPDFSAPSQVDRARALKGGPRGPKLVFVTLSTRDDSLDPSERPTRLYARFFEGDAFDGPGGLILRRFEKGSPYDLELLYLAPPDGRGFFARCPKPGEARGAAADQCLTVFRSGNLDVELRYEPAMLEQWDALIDGANAFLERLRARPRGK